MPPLINTLSYWGANLLRAERQAGGTGTLSLWFRTMERVGGWRGGLTGGL
jgi:hypothetical protein